MAYDADFPYGCDCGEQYRSFYAARDCRKCRYYLHDDERTGRVIFEPTEGEFVVLVGFHGTYAGKLHGPMPVGW